MSNTQKFKNLTVDDLDIDNDEYCAGGRVKIEANKSRRSGEFGSGKRNTIAERRKHGRNKRELPPSSGSGY